MANEGVDSMQSFFKKMLNLERKKKVTQPSKKKSKCEEAFIDQDSWQNLALNIEDTQMCGLSAC